MNCSSGRCSGEKRSQSTPFGIIVYWPGKYALASFMAVFETAIRVSMRSTRFCSAFLKTRYPELPEAAA
jgi:hypothetical protein